MAEVAGLGLGVLALAGLFKDCVDLLSLISTSFELERDFDLLETKLDVEKTLLLQWADRVDLLSERDHDPRLDASETSEAIARILSSIRKLLSESNNLQRRYGLRKIQASTELDRPGQPLSSYRMARTMRRFYELGLGSDSERREMPLLGRIRWVIQDKDRFDILVNDLSYFVTRLGLLIPDTGDRTISMISDDLDGLWKPETLKLILRAAIGRQTIVESPTNRQLSDGCTEKMILSVLEFREMDKRESTIASAHFNTLNWIFEPPSTDITWDDFSDWLRAGTDIYWISGKAGSGKSTLVKHLYHHDKTQHLLELWAGSDQLVMANFYFWNLGTPEQKSQEGLGRSLLHHILK